LQNDIASPVVAVDDQNAGIGVRAYQARDSNLKPRYLHALL
jgi:hypothetical protein